MSVAAYTRQIGVPVPEPRDATAAGYDLARCTLCHGELYARCATLIESTYPGVTVLQCRSCGVRETPAMRESMRQRLRAASVTLRAGWVLVEGTCKRCHGTFPVQLIRYGRCGDCRRPPMSPERRAHIVAQARARRLAKRPSIVGQFITADCASPRCGVTFTYRSLGGKLRKFCCSSCRSAGAKAA